LTKQQSSQKHILKIHSSILRRSKWSLNIPFEEAKKNKDIISLADSEMLRFIRNIKDYEIDENEILHIKKEIDRIKKETSSIENRKKIKELQNKKDNLLYTQDYVCIIMDKNTDFDKCNRKKGFFINGIKYKRMVGTTGGIKKETIVYVNEEVFDELNKRVDNGRNKEIPLVPAKLEAYKSLTCSSSIPVSKPKGVLVIKDGTTHFKANVIKIDDSNGERPNMERIEDYPIDLDFCDGCAMLLPSLSKRWAKELGEELKEDEYISGFCIRQSWCKGMVFTFDFIDFAEKIAKNYIVKDVWGNDVDVRNVEIVLTTNMLKLWNCYNSVEHYLSCCEENGYTFGVTKYCPKELENERNMNYQFLQSYDFSDEDIDELIKPTVDEIHDVLEGDYRKALLFLKGVHMTDKNAFDSKNDLDFIKALLVEPEMMKDPFVKQRIHNAIEKRINDSKIGVIKVRGDYSIVAGDVYALCQSMFGLKITGLLKANEYYSRTWLDRGVNDIVAFRAPMTCANNIKPMHFVNKNCANYWFKYMTTCTVINGWDTTTHAMNGMDEDADAIIETNNPVLLRNTKKLDALVCMQKSAQKVIVEEKHLIKSNKDGFGDDIGSTTNRITGMFEVLAGVEKISVEHDELMYRIRCGQHYQQCAIDKAKGIMSNPMPKEWYDYKVNKINANDTEEVKKEKEFNLRILANKKPYFFNYIYPNEMNKYKRYIRNTNEKCLLEFCMNVNELEQKEDKTEKEIEFLKYYNIMMPVGMNPCVLNKICWRIEGEFDGFLNKIYYKDFDYTILKSKDYLEYSQKDFNKIKDLYKQYNKEINDYAQISKTQRIDKDDKKSKRNMFKEEFITKAYEICNNKYELSNIVIDLCYKNNSSKQFVWDIVGDVIVTNLLKRNNYKINYPVLDGSGDINFGGYKFSMREKIVESEENN
jgi:hypothetical protein